MLGLGRTAIAALFVATLMGCATDGDGPPPPVVSGVALPEGYRLDLDRTLIVGEGPRWTGRLSYGINSSTEDMFDFVRRQMVAQGWSEVSVMRGRMSTLSFQHQGTQRAATVQVSPRPLWGSFVDIVVAPMSDTAGSPRASATGIGPAITPAPREQVTTQPLK
jgi:hypothetical protein